MNKSILALLAAATLAPACVHAQTNTFTDVTVRPQFAAVLSQLGLDTGLPFFATPAGAADPANPQGYGLGQFSFITAAPGQAQFEIDNDTFIFNGAGPNDPGGNGPVSLPFDITNDVTLENLALREIFMDGYTQTVPLFITLPDMSMVLSTSLNTGDVFLLSQPFAFDAVNGDPTHGLLASATLTGALDQTNLTIAQPAAAPEPSTFVPVAVGGLLLAALALRRRKQNAA